MNIVDKLTGGRNDGPSLEEKTRHDVLYTQLRARNPHLGPENIDLSGVDFSVSDDDLRAQVARERGITSETAIAAIDLDEVIIPDGKTLRRARRKYARAVERKRAKGQRAFRRTQRVRRFNAGRPSNHAVVLLRREHAAALAAKRAEVKS